MLLVLLLACGPSPGAVHTTIEAARACTTAQDCVNVGSVCPFGCYIVVTKAQADTVEDVLRRYRKATQGAECVYDCAAPGEITCAAGKCGMVGH